MTTRRWEKAITPTERLEKNVTRHDVNHLGGFFFVPGPENEVMRKQRVELLNRAMREALKPYEERIIRQHWGLNDIEQLTVQQIAELRERSRQPTDERIKKAERKLRVWFQRHPELMQPRDFSEFEE